MRIKKNARIEMLDPGETTTPEMRLLYAILLCALKDWQTKGRQGGYKGESLEQRRSRQSRERRTLESYFFKDDDSDNYGSLSYIAHQIWPRDPDALIQAIRKMLREEREIPDFRYMPHAPNKKTYPEKQRKILFVKSGVCE